MIDRWLRFIRQNRFTALQIGLLFAIGAALRFTNLGYSNFQGDEIRVLCRPSTFPTLVKFLSYLLGQREGPVGHVINCVSGWIDPTFSSEFALRLPYTTASMVALVCIVIAAWKLFDRNVAIYTGFLFATNGVLVGQARFAQYQSFVQLGVTAGLMGLVLALQDERWRTRGLYLGFIAAAGALLAHFDGAFVLLPMSILLLHWWAKHRRHPEFGKLRWHLIAAIGLYAVLVLAFYVEYISRLGAYQLAYWGQRLAGTPTDSVRVFQFFNPGPILWIYLGAAILAFTRLRFSTGWQVALAWLIPPLLFMELIFKDSRASAFDYFMPLALIAGVGLDALAQSLERLFRQRRRWAARAGVLAVLLGLGYVTYALLVDHDPEYPWQPKTILGMEVPGGNLTGSFGLPYNRSWRAIGAWFEDNREQAQTVATNEKLAIAMFYLPSDVRFDYIWRNALEHSPEVNRVYILMVDRPLSWVGQLWGWTYSQWRDNFTPQHEFVNERGEPLAAVYLLTRDEIEDRFR